MHKLNFEQVKYAVAEATPEKRLQMFRSQQVAVYVMCGGGILGQSAAEQPYGFYIDSRVGRLPYPKKAILQAVQVLIVLAEACGITKKCDFPKLPSMHNSGIW